MITINRPELIKIKRQDCFQKYPKFPWSSDDGEEFFFPEISKSYVLAVDARSTRGLAKNLSKSIFLLARQMSFDSLIFLGDCKRAWLYQKNDHKPVMQALEYLTEHKISKSFDGGIQVRTDGLSDFIQHLFWMVRCNAALPIFHFMDEGQNILGSLCQYGNLHISSLDKAADKKLVEAIGKCGFQITDGRCYGESIRGRETIV